MSSHEHDSWKHIMSDAAEKSVQIIFDEPSSIDAFEGGGHRRCAKALADAIEQLSDRDGAIGLEGPWGSGKSTVVKLAEEELKRTRQSDYRYLIFTFDLWAHQTEDFRRAFLESFVEWLSVNGLHERAATKAKDQIRDRIRKVTVESNKQYSTLGIIFLVTAPFIPFVYAWVSPFGFTEQIQNSVGWVSIIHNLAIAAVGVIYGVFLIRVVRNFPGKRQLRSLRSWTDTLSKSASIFSKDVERETTTQNIRESDPTTVEFHNIFRRLLGQFQSEKRRVVLILDNVDRLPPDAVPEIWSELRSLFAVSGYEPTPANSWSTVVVPYDKPFILNAFEPSVANGDDQPEQERRKSLIESDVVEKTFSRIVRVAPPVPTDWRKFLYDTLDQAFSPSLDEDKADKLFRILRYSFQKKGTHPSPRQIIAFVNKISALWVQWDDAIPVESLALYIIHQSKIDDDPNALLGPHLVDGRFERIAGTLEWQRDFAALLYNVEPDRANQVLLDQPIRQAITQSSSDRFIELSETPGFIEILPDVLQDIQSLSESATSLSHAASNLAALDPQGSFGESAWKQIAEAFDHLEFVDLNDEDGLARLAKIVEHQTPDRVLPMAKQFASIITSSGAPDPSKEPRSGQLWLAGIGLIHDIVQNRLGNDAPKNFLKDFPVPNDATFTLEVAAKCQELDSIRFIDLAREVSTSDLHSAYVELLSRDPTTFVRLLGEIWPTANETHQSDLLQQTAERMQAGEMATSPPDVMALIKAFAWIYGRTNSVSEARDTLNEIVKDGTLVWHGKNLQDANQHRFVGLVQWLIISIMNGPDSPQIPDNHTSFGNLSSVKTWYNESLTAQEFADDQISIVAECIAKYEDLAPWIEYALSDAHAQEFFRLVTKSVLDKQSIQYLTSTSAISSYAKVKSELGDDYANKLIDALEGHSRNIEDELNEGAILGIPDVFIGDVHGRGSKSPLSAVLAKIDEYLKKLDAAAWGEALAGEDDRLRLLIMRRRAGDLILPANIFRPALHEHALKVLQGEASPQKYGDRWQDIVSALPRSTQVSLSKELLGGLDGITMTSTGVGSFVKHYAELVRHMDLASVPEISVERLLTYLVYAATAEARSFFAGRADEIKACLGKSSAEAHGTFEDAVSGLEESGDEERQQWAKEIRISLSLPVPKSKTESDKKGIGQDGS